MKNIIYLVAVAILLNACAQVPLSVPRPWNRTLSERPVEPGSKVSIVVKTMETPLVGSDEMVNNEVLIRAKDLLERRGFIVTDLGPDYTMSIVYRTDSKLKTTTYTSNDSRAFSFMSSYSPGLGVILAGSLSTLLASAAATSQQTVKIEHTLYLHTMACELKTDDGNEVWKYDTLIENHNIDFLPVCSSLLQLAFSGLPSTHEVIPRVKKLRPGRFEDFAKLYLTKNYFMCPALPYLIKFNSVSTNTQDGLTGSVKDVENTEATLAYLDLMETAEYAVPAGSKKDWKDPTDLKIWAKASLMGKYYLGNDAKPVNVLIELKGAEDSYKVIKAKLLSDDQYLSYQAKYADWVDALKIYYNFYEAE